MKICVVGAGAIGGYLGARLAADGHAVTLIARGAHLAAIRRDGLKLVQHGEELLARPALATDSLREAGEQDLVLLALKAHQIGPVLDDLPALFGPETAMVTLQNGIPWWYFHKLDSPYRGRVVRTVDPDGALFERIDPERIVGCIAYPAATIDAPGVIRHVEGNRFPLGELDGRDTPRVRAIAEAFTAAGFKARVLDDIRSEIWLKLWGNLTFNPISALTHATLEDICRFPLTRTLAADMMREAQQVAEKLGARFRVTLDKRIAGAEAVGRHKTSMLQDVEAGKPLEIDGMLGAVLELAEMTGSETPALRALYACTSLLNDTLQGEGLRLQGSPVQASAAPAPRAALR